MTDRPRGSGADRQPSDLARKVGLRARRKQQARQKKTGSHAAWFGLGMFGLVGWSVATPALIGTALGLWLDDRWSGKPSWTLTLLIVGIALGCLNAWYWMKQESNDD